MYNILRQAFKTHHFKKEKLFSINTFRIAFLNYCYTRKISWLLPDIKNQFNGVSFSFISRIITTVISCEISIFGASKISLITLTSVRHERKNLNAFSYTVSTGFNQLVPSSLTNIFRVALFRECWRIIYEIPANGSESF